ncbi:restriction endonuclease subunit S [Halomonas alkalicola]|uniref:restriction endonuclease subunit S n=1 Tax=Halomonas alkalicola TaxID=1930622 RepID=UPI00265DEE4A|nr:restriction endonuclease subunit S [Halomonas alkalicola]
MSERVLPEGWVSTTLGELCELNPKQKLDDDLEVGFMPMSGMPTTFHEKPEFETRKWVTVKKGYTQFKNGDVLFAKITPCFENGKAAIVGDFPGGWGAGSTEYYVLRPRAEAVDTRLLLALVRTKDFLNSGELNMSGSVGHKRVPKEFVASYSFPLMPKAEQKAITDKLDELLAQVNNLKTRLDAIPAILKRFRQSVLAAAVRGELTNGQAENWSEVEFSELLEAIRSGSADKPVDDPSGVPILRSSAVRSREVDFDDVRYLSRSADLRADNYLRVGDLLFTRLSGSAEYVGNCALVKHVGRDCQYPDRLFCARLKDKRMSRYLEVFFSSESFRRHIYASLKSSAGHQRITLDAVRKAIVHLPPLEEQEDIVHRVDQLFAFADQVERQVANAQTRVNKLTQSILAKAFRGELTAEWRAENPELTSGEHSAEALLERIKAEKAKQKPAGRGRKKAAAEAAG